jgi:cobalt-precorrin-7 (C5)-methyltransferase
MNKLNVVGIGPGNFKYILPIAIETIRSSDVIIGGKRNLNALEISNKEHIVLDSDLEKIIGYIRNNKESKKISIVVSGDPSFYSILQYLMKYFPLDDFNIIPGISSVQYMFAKLGVSWADTYFGSLHGRNDVNFVEKIERFEKVALLTDKNRSYKYIAQKLNVEGFGERTMYVGINLSYDDERIIKDKVKNVANYDEELNLCVVVITNE